MSENYSSNYNIFSLRNIIIYIILAVVIYGAIYYFFLNRGAVRSLGNLYPPSPVSSPAGR